MPFMTNLSHSKMSEEKRTVKKGIVRGLQRPMMSGLWSLVMDDGTQVPFESGYGARVLANIFGFLDDIIGKKIRYTMTDYGCLESIEEVT